MAQIRIKQVAQLEQSLNAITGVTTVVESYTTNQATGNTGIKNTFEAKEVAGVKVHVNGLQIEDFSWQNVTTDYLPTQSMNPMTSTTLPLFNNTHINIYKKKFDSITKFLIYLNKILNIKFLK